MEGFILIGLYSYQDRVSMRIGKVIKWRSKEKFDNRAIKSYKLLFHRREKSI
jgi:hypothetical protein